MLGLGSGASLRDKKRSAKRNSILRKYALRDGQKKVHAIEL